MESSRSRGGDSRFVALFSCSVLGSGKKATLMEFVGRVSSVGYVPVILFSVNSEISKSSYLLRPNVLLCSPHFTACLSEENLPSLLNLHIGIFKFDRGKIIWFGWVFLLMWYAFSSKLKTN